MSERTLSRDEAKAFYDRYGSKQDSQRFYEDAAVEELVWNAEFQEVQRVVEFGCGTGRVAEHLLRNVLPETATYAGVDLSATMVRIARQRLARFGERVRVEESASLPSGSADRVVATYVLDLLSEADIDAFVASSASILDRGGRLCVANLTSGKTLMSALVSILWRVVFRLKPAAVGGCRPIDFRRFIDGKGFRILHHAVVSRYGIASQVLVAEKI